MVSEFVIPPLETFPKFYLFLFLGGHLQFHSQPKRGRGLERLGWFPKFYPVLSSEVSPYYNLCMCQAAQIPHFMCFEALFDEHLEILQNLSIVWQLQLFVLNNCLQQLQLGSLWD